MNLRTIPWTAAAALVAAVLFAAALSNVLYELTSPPTLTWHVVLRKAYSIVAFALVGYLFRRSLTERGRTAVVLPCIVGVALYSALIELGQALLGSHEGRGWNAFDVACGALGGSIAVADRLRTTKSAKRRGATLEPRPEPPPH
jgi:hypothetical protein